MEGDLMVKAPGSLQWIFNSMFRGMAGEARNVGSEMSAHMPTLYILARYSTGPIIELGVGRGWSTVALVAGILDSVGKWFLHSYDINPNCEQLVWDALQLKDRKGPIADEIKSKWIFRSCLALKAVNNYQDNSIGLLFLDTSHELEATRQELKTWLPKLRPDGTIVGHDYFLHEHPHWTTKSGVKKAVDEFATKYSGRFQMHVCRYDQGLFILFPKG